MHISSLEHPVCDFFFSGGLEWAPPIMVVAVVTLFASTLDLMADFLVCSRFVFFQACCKLEPLRASFSPSASS